jgi:hypothetical protein
MYKASKIMIFGLIAALILGAASMANAQVQKPVTAIDKIFEYQNGLNLTDSQVRKLNIVNLTITEKMLEIMKQADLRKTEIDEFTSNWSSMHGTAVNHIIKEYYGFMAELKKLELEAISKARAILSAEQLRKFSELSSIETMMIKIEDQLAGTF